MGRLRAQSSGRIVIAPLALVLLMQSQSVPSSGNVLATPTPATSPGRAFAQHPSQADLKEGEQLFNVHCASCHGLSLQGTAQAPPLINVDAADVDFQLRTGRMPAMVPFEQEYDKPPFFTPPQNRAIVSYVMSKSTGEKLLPAVQVPPLSQASDETLRKGRQVYEENCQQCHAATGRGDSVGYQDVAPDLMDAGPMQIAEAVRTGPDVMPKFGPKIIDDGNLNDLVSYIQYLQRAKYNPGGMQLANWGPVSEGFMAWVFGLGLLVLLIRRIGSTE